MSVVIGEDTFEKMGAIPGGPSALETEAAEAERNAAVTRFGDRLAHLKGAWQDVVGGVKLAFSHKEKPIAAESLVDAAEEDEATSSEASRAHHLLKAGGAAVRLVFTQGALGEGKKAREHMGQAFSFSRRLKAAESQETTEDKEVTERKSRIASFMGRVATGAQKVLAGYRAKQPEQQTFDLFSHGAIDTRRPQSQEEGEVMRRARHAGRAARAIGRLMFNQVQGGENNWTTAKEEFGAAWKRVPGSAEEKSPTAENKNAQRDKRPGPLAWATTGAAALALVGGAVVGGLNVDDSGVGSTEAAAESFGSVADSANTLSVVVGVDGQVHSVPDGSASSVDAETRAYIESNSEDFLRMVNTVEERVAELQAEHPGMSLITAKEIADSEVVAYFEMLDQLNASTAEVEPDTKL